MTAPLSDDARAIAGGIFGLSAPCPTQVRFEHPKAITGRALAALTELVEAGVASCTVTNLAVTYRPLVDCGEHYTWLRENMHTGVGRFPLSTKGQGR